jgi:hypothetical protein
MTGFKINDVVAYKEAGYADIYLGTVKELSKSGVPRIMPIGPVPASLLNKDGLVVTHSAILNVTKYIKHGVDLGRTMNLPESEDLNRMVKVEPGQKWVEKGAGPKLFNLIITSVCDDSVYYDSVNNTGEWRGGGFVRPVADFIKTHTLIVERG